MKKIYSIFVLLMFLAVACNSQTNTNTDTEDDGSMEAEAQGRAVFVLTDAAANMGSVTEVEVTIESIEVHSAAEGWVTASSDQNTFSLLELKAEGKQELMADVALDEGSYDQIRLEISEVIVTDAEGEHEAKLPSEELRVNGDFTVNENSTSSIVFDFVADESLHVTGNGQYIMAPVVQVEAKEDADVEISSDNEVTIRGGRVSSNLRVGMDLNGTVGVGIKIPTNANLSIDSVGMINTKASGKVGVGVLG